MKRFSRFFLFSIMLFSVALSSCSLIEKTPSDDDKTNSKFTITWVNYDGTILEVDEDVAYGTLPTYDGETPYKPSEGDIDFTFDGWYPEVTNATYDATYVAQFKTTKYLTVTWVNYDGTLLYIDENVEYGLVPVYSGETPIRNRDAQYTYEFDGWSPEVSAITTDTTYTAIYKTTLNTYTITWKNYDGTILEVDESVAYGAMPSYDGPTPERKDSTKTYIFSGREPTILPVSSSKTYTAIFKEEGEESEPLTKQDILYTYEDFSDNSVYNCPAMPSIGSPKVLVVPIWFKDSSKYITSTSQKQTIKDDIETAYFGTEEETGWHSVKTYYQEDSYGLLNIKGEVTDWYETSYTSSITGDQTTTLVKEVAQWYKNSVTQTEYKSFDTNNDGYLDALILIYGANDYSANSIIYNDNLWAYCYWVQDSSLQNTKTPGPNTFFWASYDFMYKDQYHYTIDSHTFIHEMGHVLGLSDYYDYYSNGNTPAGGFSMQDCNVGGHDPFSKMALGWVKPYVPTEDVEIGIGTFQETGDIIVLSSNFTGSPFDEYLILELYSPTGLNEMDSKYNYENNSFYPKGPNAVGIRLWHVDARLRGTYVSGQYINFDGSKYYTSFDTASSPYGFALAMSNTTYAQGSDSNGYCALFSTDYKYDLLAQIRNNDANDSGMNNYLSSDSLFRLGDVFSVEEYTSAFPNKTKMNNGTTLGFSFEVTELTSNGAAIQINKL